MITSARFIQRCIIVLAILLCYFHVRSEEVNCEVHPFHRSCRGTQSRKRTMFPTILNSGYDENFQDRRYIPYVPLSKSELLVALLNNNLQKDITRFSRHKERNNEINAQTPPLMESFLSELESSDNY